MLTDNILPQSCTCRQYIQILIFSFILHHYCCSVYMQTPPSVTVSISFLTANAEQLYDQSQTRHCIVGFPWACSTFSKSTYIAAWVSASVITNPGLCGYSTAAFVRRATFRVYTRSTLTSIWYPMSCKCVRAYKLEWTYNFMMRTWTTYRFIHEYICSFLKGVSKSEYDFSSPIY